MAATAGECAREAGPGVTRGHAYDLRGERRDLWESADSRVLGHPGPSREPSARQLSATNLDARTDVFALGVIAYEMLCGDLPFSRGSLTDVILAQARGARPLTERDAAIPAAVDRAARRALEMTPDERPATPHAFASEVLQALDAST